MLFFRYTGNFQCDERKTLYAKQLRASLSRFDFSVFDNRIKVRLNKLLEKQKTAHRFGIKDGEVS